MIYRAWIRETAKFRFKQRYGMCVGAALLLILLAGDSLIYYGFTGDGSGYVNGIRLPDRIWSYIYGVLGVAALVHIFVGMPLRIGNAHFNRCIYNGWQTGVDDMFRRGFDDYGRNLGGIFLRDLFIVLWSLLFVIPGIVKSYAYFATPYILAEFPAVQPLDAITLSRRMTYGFKGELFVLNLSFIGWYLLSGLTLGLVGILYVNPYYHACCAGYYEVIKAHALNTGRISWWELAGYPVRQAE